MELVSVARERVSDLSCTRLPKKTFHFQYNSTVYANSHHTIVFKNHYTALRSIPCLSCVESDDHTSRAFAYLLSLATLDSRNKSFKVRSCILNIQKSGCRLDMRIRYNHHNVRVCRKGIDKGCKSRVATFHALELLCALPH